MRLFIILLLLAGCTAQQASVTAPPVETEHIAEDPPAQEMAQERALDEDIKCEPPLLTGPECGTSECAQHGGRCVGDNGCFACIDPPCPEGTGACDDSCGSCMKVAQAGTTECFACVPGASCPEPYYDDASLCEALCEGKCILTNTIRNKQCFECRGAA